MSIIQSLHKIVGEIFPSINAFRSCFESNFWKEKLLRFSNTFSNHLFTSYLSNRNSNFSTKNSEKCNPNYHFMSINNLKCYFFPLRTQNLFQCYPSYQYFPMMAESHNFTNSKGTFASSIDLFLWGQLCPNINFDQSP